MLNTVFAKFGNTAETPLTVTEYLGNYYSDSPCDECTVTNEDVLNLISGDISKANGPDGILAYMLATAESIASPLAKLFSLPLSIQGSFLPCGNLFYQL